MHVLIDTNVILDVLLSRESFCEDSSRILGLAEKGILHSFVSASAITDIFYIVKKELKSKNEATNLLKKLLQTVRVAAVTESHINFALNLQWSDFEDSVQYSVGESIRVEYIITRNVKDFEKGKIKVRTSKEFLDEIGIT